MRLLFLPRARSDRCAESGASREVGFGRRPPTPMVATVFDGVARHSPEGVWWKRRAEEVGFRQAVVERDSGDPIAPEVAP